VPYVIGCKTATGNRLGSGGKNCFCFTRPAGGRLLDVMQTACSLYSGNSCVSKLSSSYSVVSCHFTRLANATPTTYYRPLLRFLTFLASAREKKRRTIKSSIAAVPPMNIQGNKAKHSSHVYMHSHQLTYY